MEWYSLIFFHIFKFYFKDGRFKNDVPWFTATALITVSFWLYLTSLIVLASHHFAIDPLKMENKNLFICFAFLFFLANIYWFQSRNRYLVIYRKFRNTTQDTPKKTILAWAIVFGGLLSLPVTVFFLNFESLSDWLSMWKR